MQFHGYETAHVKLYHLVLRQSPASTHLQQLDGRVQAGLDSVGALKARLDTQFGAYRRSRLHKVSGKAGTC